MKAGDSIDDSASIFMTDPDDSSQFFGQACGVAKYHLSARTLPCEKMLDRPSVDSEIWFVIEIISNSVALCICNNIL